MLEKNILSASVSVLRNSCSKVCPSKKSSKYSPAMVISSASFLLNASLPTLKLQALSVKNMVIKMKIIIVNERLSFVS